MSLGQAFTMVLTASNGGGAGALNVAPVLPLTRIGNITPDIFSGPVPASVTLAAGLSQAFTFTGINNNNGAGLSPWTLAYSVQISGTDQNSGQLYSSNSISSSTSTVSVPAALSSSLALSPSQLDANQPYAVSMTVTNNGDVPALNVLPSILVQQGSGGTSLVSPGSQTPTLINGKSSVVFVWTYSAVGTGTLTLRGNASGTDSNSLFQVSSTATNSNLLSIQAPAALAVNSMSVAPASIGTGNPISVIMEIKNVGQATALNVSGTAALNVVGTGNATYSSGPSPALVASLAQGEFGLLHLRVPGSQHGPDQFLRLGRGAGFQQRPDPDQRPGIGRAREYFA